MFPIVIGTHDKSIIIPMCVKKHFFVMFGSFIFCFDFDKYTITYY